MTKMHRQSLVAYGEPLCETIVDCPTPRGSEVLVRVKRCGVCHSDLHLQDGYFALGNDKRLDITKDRPLPFTLGHEIAGVIEGVGPDAEGAAIGARVAVYPWIGCGSCAACRAGEENLCSAHHHLGITADGGFASHVLVPHARYLLDYAPLPAALAGPLMCSGLTAYGALKHLDARAERGPVLMSASGGVLAACDFVGSDRSLQFCTGVLARGGKIVVTGLLGGTFSMAAAMFAIKAMTIEGTLTGTLAQARELIELARAGKIAPIPTHERPFNEAQAALDDLRAGKVVGRTVLAN
jgi:D-arabinose 1-dehydrogenase-like Zn-dependent alcohol dehydrogenase